MIACDPAIRKKRKEKRPLIYDEKLTQNVASSSSQLFAKKLITSGSNYGLKRVVFTGHAYSFFFFFFFFFFLREGALVRLLAQNSRSTLIVEFSYTCLMGAYINYKNRKKNVVRKANI